MGRGHAVPGTTAGGGSVDEAAGAQAPRWMNTGVADDLLSVVGEAGVPVGARQIRAALSRRGRDLSESTIARRLRDLDDRGLTVQLGAKGRVLTADGALTVAALRRDSQGARLMKASEVRTAADVIHLLKARRAVEPEAVRDATAHTSEADHAELQRIVEEHSARVEADESPPRDLALGFHRRVSARTQNPLLQAMLAIVLDEALDRVEAVLDVILESHHHSDRSVSEHLAIVRAMSEGDEERAAELMHGHLDRLLDEVDAYLRRHDPALVERMLRWA